MDFTSCGQINNYVKSIDMQQKWQQKKQSGDLSADGTKSVSQWVEEQKNKFSQNDNGGSGDKTLTGIRNKLSCGGKLSPSEMRYLQKKDPIAYAQAMDVEAERAAYIRELKKCRTKEEVQRFKMSHAAKALTTVNSVMNDPNIPQEKKLSAVMSEQQKMSAIDKETAEFVKSGEYSALPTERERLKAEKDMEKAKAEEKRCKDSNEKAAEQERKPVHKDENGNKTEKKVSAHKKEKPRFTEEQAKNTPEARKVRRARAKAAYEENKDSYAKAILTSHASDIDNKA